MGKKGVLITNAFLRTEKFVEHYQWLQQAAVKYQIELELMDNACQLSFCGEDLTWLDQYDFVLFWDKDIPLGKEITRYGADRNIPVFNSVDSIAACDDKWETYHRISSYNNRNPQRAVPILPTICAPMTYSNVGYPDLGFLDQIQEKLSYPMVVKECFGSFGQQVYLAQDRGELEKLTEKLAGIPFLYQKYHQHSSGRDVRLQVVGDRVVAAMYRFSRDGDFRANITNGGEMEKYIPSEEEQELAVRVAKILGLDFAGVDLLFSPGNDHDCKGSQGDDQEQMDCADILCEVNSNAHFQNIYACTGVNVAECILEYIQSVLC